MTHAYTICCGPNSRDERQRCVRLADMSILCWGRQAMSEENARLLPQRAERVGSPDVTLRFVETESDVASLSAAQTAACAVHADSIVRCTGVSNTGSLGRGVLVGSQGPAKPVLYLLED